MASKNKGLRGCGLGVGACMSNCRSNSDQASGRLNYSGGGEHISGRQYPTPNVDHGGGDGLEESWMMCYGFVKGFPVYTSNKFSSFDI